MAGLQRVSAGSGAVHARVARCTWRWAHMEKDREPAVDAIATWFSTMLDNVGALTSRSSQIASLGLCRARIEGWRVVLPSASRAKNGKNEALVGIRNGSIQILVDHFRNGSRRSGSRDQGLS